MSEEKADVGDTKASHPHVILLARQSSYARYSRQSYNWRRTALHAKHGIMLPPRLIGGMVYAFNEGRTIIDSILRRRRCCTDSSPQETAYSAGSVMKAFRYFSAALGGRCAVSKPCISFDELPIKLLPLSASILMLSITIL